MDERTDAPARRRVGIRVRITVAATAVVAIALLIGGVAFWAVLRTSLYDTLAAAAAQDAQSIAAQVDGLDLEDIRDDGLDDLDGVLPDFDDRFFQIVDPGSGRVVASSETAGGAASVVRSDGSVPDIVQVGGMSYAAAANHDDSDWIVVAGRSIQQADQTLSTVAILLAVAVPLLIAVVAATCWVVARRALAPVERMRREVDAVTASELSRRVADPGSQDEIGRLARTLNGMLARLEAAAATQRRFISDASHELRSPLAALRQYAEVAQTHPDRIGADELSDAVLAEGARLEQLVHGLLLLARADEHGIVPAVADVDLDDLLFAEARRLRTDGRVRVDVSAVAPVRVRGDAGLLAQVVRNLVDNAARHAATAIALGSSENVEGVDAWVDDDGAGIAEGDRERVFDRFVRLDAARSRDAGGSGLGLAIVREVVSAHGGEVRVLTSPLGGARFTVRLPAPRT